MGGELAKPLVGASMLAMAVNDDACCLDERIVLALRGAASAFHTRRYPSLYLPKQFPARLCLCEVLHSLHYFY
ncbi:hypothetical protein F2A38_17005 [Pseudomonas chlororaphis]|uniref:Uncharacterized protein n=1 Tax=Pseudomonas chlororaphis TaxID=587753 RepID=A0AB34C3U5_9PSED|nr:hypothetical protein F2A38_17005 [Pseudomonas chlororaphis]